MMFESVKQKQVVGIIAADTEWKYVKEFFPGTVVSSSPFGEYFEGEIASKGQSQPVVFFHTGWGKIAASAGTQYAIDHYDPDLLINLGTCGGFAGLIRLGDIILANKTIVYDILEKMGDAEEAIAAYSTEIDTAWAGAQLPKDVWRGILLSADRDIVQSDLTELQHKYKATAADWESGAIAWVAARNQIPILVLRGVSDVVSKTEAYAYDSLGHFEQGTHAVMNRLLLQLPQYLDRWRKVNKAIP